MRRISPVATADRKCKLYGTVLGKLIFRATVKWLNGKEKAERHSKKLRRHALTYSLPDHYSRPAAGGFSCPDHRRAVCLPPAFLCRIIQIFPGIFGARALPGYGIMAPGIPPALCRAGRTKE